MAQVFETIMLLCFGVSWPFNIAKSLHSRTAKGKSLQFEICVVIGYLFGIGAKIIGHVSGAAPLNYVFAVYIFNLVMVSGNIVVYFINKKHDRENGLIK